MSRLPVVHREQGAEPGLARHHRVRGGEELPPPVLPGPAGRGQQRGAACPGV